MDAVQGPRQPKRWTEEEDAILHEEAIKQASLGPIKDWHRIAAKLANRTNKDCRKRWFNKVRGGLRTGPWSEDEDQKLRQAVEKYGQRWTLISQEFGSRSSDQCAKRWQYTLDPKLGHRQWTSGEDHLLLELVQSFGHDWKFICQQHYPSRSRTDVKNRYTILNRRLAAGAPGESPSEVASPLDPPGESSNDIPESLDHGNDTMYCAEDDLHYFTAGIDSLEVPEPLSAGVAGHQSTPEQGISFPDDFDFNLEGDPSHGDAIMDGCTDSPFFSGSQRTFSAYLTGAADEPSWQFTNTDGALSPSAAAPSEGSHAGQTFTNMFDLELDNKGHHHLSKAFNNLESPTGTLQFIEGLDPRGTEPDFRIAGGGDKRSSSFSVVLVAEECDHELVKYLIDVTKPIKGRVKMEVVM
ncbi:Myb-related protein B like [Verticillium longisporum]|nr:Myb-related protein B like [Verticillium longisporum]